MTAFLGPDAVEVNTFSPRYRTIVLFDGVCNLCNGAVDFLLRHDQGERLWYASLQSEAGSQLLEAAGLTPGSLGSLVVVHGERIYVESDAVLEIARLLPAPWCWFTLFRVIPRPVRNRLYRFVARHRYDWLGRRDTCRVPRPEERARFVG